MSSVKKNQDNKPKVEQNDQDNATKTEQNTEIQNTEIDNEQKSRLKKAKKATAARLAAGCGVLTAVAVVLQFLEFPIPVIPSFIKLDFSDLPELIGAFAYGPLAGIGIALLKNVIHLAVSQSAFIGELSNFLLAAVFCGTAGFIYQRNHTEAGALLAGLIATACMAVVCYPLNLFVIYPMYYNILGFPESAVLDLYRAIVPLTPNISVAILIFNVPFTFLKGAVCVLGSALLYPRVSIGL